MENPKTDFPKLFYSLRNADIQMADTIIILCRAVIAIFALIAIAAGAVLYAYVMHWIIALTAAAFLMTSLFAIVLLWFLLPATVDDLLEDDALQAAIAKQESWRIPD